MDSSELAGFVRESIERRVRESGTVTAYREPGIGFVAASDPGFAGLSQLAGKAHLQPGDLLPGARSVVCFFLPFAASIPAANARDREKVAREWAVAYVETNALINQITSGLIESLGRLGVRAAAEPATGNFDEASLRSHWSHKSIAVLAGLGSFGLHQMVITDAGCAGRFGSFVIDADLPIDVPPHKERCAYYALGSCLDCLVACPVAAIDQEAAFDRRACWEQCLKNAGTFLDLGDDVQVCGKCAVAGPCTLESAV